MKPTSPFISEQNAMSTIYDLVKPSNEGKCDCVFNLEIITALKKSLNSDWIYEISQ